MGTDNLFHKRKARSVESLRRKAAQRAPYDVVLIVCEGGKTEPNYFNSIKKHLRLNTANITIVENREGSAPISVVDCAISEYEKSVDEKLPFDKVFCVFDKDKHSTFQQALNKIGDQQAGIFFPIISVPCFEVWILLHFVYTTKPFESMGSNCSQLISDLKKDHISDYHKNFDIFDFVKDKTNDAIKAAKMLEKFHRTSGTDNPSTKVYFLVEYLFALQER